MTTITYQSDTYENEQLSSSRTYPCEYDGPKPIEEQITALAEILGLDPANALEYVGNLPELPVEAEGWFAILSQSGLKKLFPHIVDYNELYCAGVLLVHDKIRDMRRFSTDFEPIGPDCLRTHSRTVCALDLIAKDQPGDILIVAGQLGMRHRGRSVRRARKCFKGSNRDQEALLPGDEFGLSSLAVGSIVLTHPNRLAKWIELSIDCPGDEYDDTDEKGRFSHATAFDFFNDGVVVFVEDWYGEVADSNGPASAFLPQS